MKPGASAADHGPDNTLERRVQRDRRGDGRAAQGQGAVPTSGLGASHGIAYVLGAAFDIPHGHASCNMLPAVMRWNRPANAARQILVATAMGHPGEDAAGVLEAFIAGLGMPHNLSAVGIGSESFDRIAEGAMATPWVPRNPRPIAGPLQVRQILDLAT